MLENVSIPYIFLYAKAAPSFNSTAKHFGLFKTLTADAKLTPFPGPISTN